MENPEIFILDTGATTNSTGNPQGMSNFRATGGSATRMGNGSVITASTIGDLRGTICDNKGLEIQPVTLTDVHVLPGSPFNIISGTKLLMKGFTVKGNHNEIIYVKDNHQIKFDIKIETERGVLFAIKIKRNNGQMSKNLTNLKPTISIEEAHRKLGHLNENTTRSVSKELGWVLSRGNLKPCSSCTIEKHSRKHQNNHSQRKINVFPKQHSGT